MNFFPPVLYAEDPFALNALYAWQLAHLPPLPDPMALERAPMWRREGAKNQKKYDEGRCWAHQRMRSPAPSSMAKYGKEWKKKLDKTRKMYPNMHDDPEFWDLVMVPKLTRLWDKLFFPLPLLNARSGHDLALAKLNAGDLWPSQQAFWHGVVAYFIATQETYYGADRDEDPPWSVVSQATVEEIVKERERGVAGRVGAQGLVASLTPPARPRSNLRQSSREETRAGRGASLLRSLRGES